MRAYQDHGRPEKRLSVAAPVIVLVLAFTAVPMELQSLGRPALRALVNWQVDVPDIVANISGYIPVGMVLASRGAWPAVGIAASVSMVAETSQLFTKGRSPSLIDVATNILGAVLGFVVAVRWKSRWKTAFSELPISRRTASLAGALALAYVGLGASLTPLVVEDILTTFLSAPAVAWLPVNPRGATTPGKLEAHWTFDGAGDDAGLDASGNGLNGVLVRRPTLVPGIDGSALRLNGVDQSADFGNPTALRLTGSMTISAWINTSAFPVDDAAIVSDYNELGYQLDTTVDQGPRTIGFKLADASGRLMARYGRTRLTTNRWYHVAGVYDARAQALHVYLNGQLDDGCVAGTISTRQRISGVDVYVGRRGGQEGFEFAGSIDDVRVYSRPLTRNEIEADMRRASGSRSLPLATGHVSESVSDQRCDETGASSHSPDGRASGLFAVFGLLVAITCVGLWPTASYRIPCLVLSFGAGFLLFPSVAATLPTYVRWVIPLLTLAGGASIAASVRVGLRAH